jgi:hypothetical protein
MLASRTFDALAPERLIATHVLPTVDTGKFEFVHNFEMFQLVISGAAFGDHFRLTSSELPETAFTLYRRKQRERLQKKGKGSESPEPCNRSTWAHRRGLGVSLAPANGPLPCATALRS